MEPSGLGDAIQVSIVAMAGQGAGVGVGTLHPRGPPVGASPPEQVGSSLLASAGCSGGLPPTQPHVEHDRCDPTRTGPAHVRLWNLVNVLR